MTQTPDHRAHRKPGRVLLVSPSYTPFVGGAQAFLRAMAERLAGDGYDVTVLTSNARYAQDLWLSPGKGDAPLSPREVLRGVSVERLPLAYPWPSPHAFGLLRRAGHWLHGTRLPERFRRRLLTRLARWMPPLGGLEAALDRLVPQADLVHAEDASWEGPLLAAARQAQRHGRPFVAQPLMHLGDARVRAHFQMAHQVAAYRRADAVVALSQREGEAFEQLGVARSRIHVLPMGVDPEPAASAQPSARAEFRRQQGLPGPVVAFLGANTYDKGAFTLAQAVARLNLGGLEISLICAGPQSEGLASFLRGQPPSERAALRGHVRLLGVVDEETKHRMLAACDLLALPSQVDAFGIVLLEAWLHGKPVIGADAGGIPELVRPGQTGLLVPFGDAEALASAIRQLTENPQLAARLGAAGRRLVLERYTWARTYRSLLDIYAIVLGGTHGS